MAELEQMLEELAGDHHGAVDMAEVRRRGAHKRRGLTQRAAGLGVVALIALGGAAVLVNRDSAPEVEVATAAEQTTAPTVLPPTVLAPTVLPEPVPAAESTVGAEPTVTADAACRAAPAVPLDSRLIVTVDGPSVDGESTVLDIYKNEGRREDGFLVLTTASGTIYSSAVGVYEQQAVNSLNASFYDLNRDGQDELLLNLTSSVSGPLTSVLQVSPDCTFTDYATFVAHYSAATFSIWGCSNGEQGLLRYWTQVRRVDGTGENFESTFELFDFGRLGLELVDTWIVESQADDVVPPFQPVNCPWWFDGGLDPSVRPLLVSPLDAAPTPTPTPTPRASAGQPLPPCATKPPLLVGEPFASSDFSNQYVPVAAFDGSMNTHWLSAAGEPLAFVGIRLQNASTVVVYRIGFTSGAEPSAAAPRTWELQGSTGGGTWTTVDVRSNETAWLGSESRSYVVAQPGEYATYRLVVTRDDGPGEDVTVLISELELLAECDF